MAPRRRPTKKGETRLDAALDAMAPYGFPNKLVRTTISQLLKVVYGGSEGWVFIEDSAYTLLIDTLLENQSNPSPQDGPNEELPAECSNRPLLPCSNTQTSDHASLTNQATDTLSATSGTGIQLLMENVDTASATNENSSEVPIKPADISSVTSKHGNQLFTKAVVDSASANSETPMKAVDTIKAENESDCQPAGNLALSEVHGPMSPQLVGRLGHKKRRPCYGWISSDDEDEEVLIELPPAPLSKVSSMLAK